MPLKSFRLTLLLATLTLFAEGSSAWAFVFSPMSVQFESKGPGATQSFTIENDGETPAPIEISVVPRRMDLDGKETYAKDPATTKLFLIYPPMVMLKPKEKRVVRVTWAGGDAPKQSGKELAFRLIAEQLPLSPPKKDKKSQKTTDAQIQMLLRYVGAIYISDDSFSPQLKLQKAAVLTRGKAPAELEIILDNQGTAHQVLSTISLDVTGPKGVVSLGASEIPAISSQNVLAKSSRRFVIPLPKSLAGAAAGTIKTEMRIDSR